MEGFAEPSSKNEAGQKRPDVIFGWGSDLNRAQKACERAALSEGERWERKWLKNGGPSFVTYNCQQLTAARKALIARAMEGAIVGLQGTKEHCYRKEDFLQRESMEGAMKFYHFRAQAKKGDSHNAHPHGCAIAVPAKWSRFVRRTVGANWGDGRIVGRVGAVESNSWKAIVCYAVPGNTEEARLTNKEVWKWVRQEAEKASERQIVTILTDANGRVGK